MAFISLLCVKFAAARLPSPSFSPTNDLVHWYATNQNGSQGASFSAEMVWFSLTTNSQNICLLCVTASLQFSFRPLAIIQSGQPCSPDIDRAVPLHVGVFVA